MNNSPSPVLKALYSIFIAILLATFVAVGIDAFYESPKYPEYPIELRKPDQSDLDIKEQRAFEEVQKQYQDKSRNYNRNVSIITAIISIVVLIASLTLLNKLQLIADGIMLGGVFILIYSILRGFASDDNKYRFIVVSIGLFVSLILGYIKFIKPQKA